MKNRKDIGKAFREKLDHLEKTPDDRVWNAIHADLQKEKKRRAFLIPFWLKIGGMIALGLLLSLLVFKNSKNSHVFSTPSVRFENSGGNKVHNNKNLKNKPHFNISATESFKKDSEIVKHSEISKPPKSINEKVESGLKAKNYEVLEKNVSVSKNKTAIYKNRKTEKNATEKVRKVNVAEKSGSKLSNTKIANKRHGHKKYAGKFHENYNATSEKTAKEQLLTQSLGKDAVTGETSIGKENPVKGTEPGTDKTHGTSATENDAAKKEPAITVTDSLKGKKKLKEPSQEKKDSTKIVEITKINLFVYGAPTYSGTFSKISAIDKRLTNNPKSSRLSWSYGAYAMYEATPKWSLRFGISKTSLKLVTGGAAIDTADYSNISYKSMNNAMIYSQSGNAEKMDIIQEISYTEIPLELKYAISTKKFGINAYGGLSYMFIGKNKVTAETSTGKTFEIGETKNLSTNTYSLNFGIGLDYKFSRRLRINLEPVFKYHLNDYKNVGRINPYTISILTGLQFSLHK